MLPIFYIFNHVFSCFDDSCHFIFMMLCALRVYIGSIRVAVISSALPSSRCYSGHHKATGEYKNYRKGLTALRSNLVDAHKDHIRMTVEDVGSETAQAARAEKEREERALQKNEMELKRMAYIRYKIILNDAYQILMPLLL